MAAILFTYRSFYPTFLILFLLGFVYPFKGVEAQNDADPLIDIRFEYSSMVATGEKFAFVITFQKQPGYKPAGSIRQIWPKGFWPVATENEFGKISIEGQQITISWDKMIEIGTFSIVYFVEVGDLPGSAYAIFSEYKDVIGTSFQKANVINVLSKEIIHTPKTPEAEIEPSISITADYPREVMKNSSIELSFTITKGKNVSPAELHISLPPGFAPASGLSLQHSFDQATRLLIISWDHLPPHPAFEVVVDLAVGETSIAAYPFYATLRIEKKTQVIFSDYFIVTNQPGNHLSSLAINAQPASSIDTGNLFTELDSLLNKWMESTSTSTQNPSEQEILTPEINENKIDESKATSLHTGTEYRIQVFASTVRAVNLRKKLLEMDINQQVKEEFDGTTYRYTMGSFEDLNSARDYLKALRVKGLTDAFTVKYVNDVREK